MSTSIFRYQVPVDDQPHDRLYDGPIFHVACRHLDTVEFWAHAPTPGPDKVPHRLIVVGTGHSFPDDWEYRGTTLAGPLVWHLMEMPVKEDAREQARHH